MIQRQKPNQRGFDIEGRYQTGVSIRQIENIVVGINMCFVLTKELWFLMFEQASDVLAPGERD